MLMIILAPLDNAITLTLQGNYRIEKDCSSFSPVFWACLLVKKQSPLRGLVSAVVKELDLVDDVGEDVADRGPEQGEDDDDNDGDEYEDQSVLNHTLAFFFESEFHDV